MHGTRSVEKLCGSQQIEAANNSSSYSQLSRSDWIPCVVVIGIATLIILPLFVRGLPAGADAGWHFRRAIAFNQAIRDGNTLYPRWLPSANNGMGSPVMLYYPPFSFIVTAAFDFIVNDTMLALSLCCWAGLVMSGLAMYVATRTLLPRWTAAFCAILYITQAYHLLDLFQGAALGEFWSFAWIPLVLLAIKLVGEGRGLLAGAGLAVSYALLLYTHMPMAFALTCVLPFVAIATTTNVKRLTTIAAALALGGGLSASYVLPVIFERKYVHFDAFLRFDYLQFFMFERLKSAFAEPLMQHTVSAYSDPLGMKAYVYQLKTEQAAFLLPILFTISTLVIIVNRRTAGKPLWGNRTIRAIWLITIGSMIMSCRLSAPLWKVIPGISYLLFPYRWLVITTAGTCVIAGVALTMLSFASRISLICSIVFVITVVSGMVISGFVIARAPYDSGVFDVSQPRREVPEYRTVWWDRQLHENDQLPPLAVTRGDADIQIINGEGIRQSYELDARMDTALKLRTLYFPGWTAQVDGRPTEVAPNDEGHIQLSIEPGQHSLLVRFEDTLPRTSGKIVSAISLLITIILIYCGWRNRA